MAESTQIMRPRVLLMVGIHYVATATLGYFSYLLWRGDEILFLAALAAIFITLLVAIKTVGESLEFAGLIGSPKPA